jgi:hypothetical protein
MGRGAGRNEAFGRGNCDGLIRLHDGHCYDRRPGWHRRRSGIAGAYTPAVLWMLLGGRRIVVLMVCDLWCLSWTGM